jgi:CRISPR/Cas system-associated exonuclease Cas4 (RecB family)
LDDFMTETLLLSRYKLDTFLTCQRRFHLRFRRQLPWPDRPLADRWAEGRERGEQFHRLLERHFLGLTVTAEAIEDVELRRWWSLFQRSLFQRHVKLPEGETHPERSLTVPVGRHVLNGRFDLLILSPTGAHIFDWKTGQPRSEADLGHDWQTRLYLAMLAEGGAALGHVYQPDQIAITYWYVNDPAAPRTIRYNPAWHEQNWTDVQAIVGQIDAALVQDVWPLTDDLAHCRQCAYQAYCGRQEAGEAVPDESDEATDEANFFLEPEIP